MSESTVLIADDSELMCDRLAGLLKELGFTIFVKVYNGKQALLEYKSKKIDLVFLDLHMPIIDGIETLRQIKKINNDAYVVVISGTSTMANVKKALGLGAKGFIVKPCGLNKLQEAVDKYRQWQEFL